MISLRSSTSAACCCRSFARSSCSPLTAAETSFSFAITSRIMSLRALSSSTVVVSVEKAFSRSSRSVFDSRFCRFERSVWIFERFSAMFGLPFRFRQSSFVDSRSARATSWICSWFSFAFCLFESAFSVARCAISSSYRVSSPRCSCMIRVISSPTIVESSSRCAMMSGVIDARNESFSSASSTIEDILALSITESAMAQRVAQASVTAVQAAAGRPVMVHHRAQREPRPRKTATPI